MFWRSRPPTRRRPRFRISCSQCQRSVLRGPLASSAAEIRTHTAELLRLPPEPASSSLDPTCGVSPVDKAVESRAKAGLLRTTAGRALHRIALHPDSTMLARLSEALVRAQAVPPAA